MIRFQSRKLPVVYLGSQCWPVLQSRLAHNQAAAPIKSYQGITNPIRLFWHHKMPTTTKYFSYMISLAFILTHYHPNTLVTVGPPLVLAGWLGYKNWFKYNLNQLIKVVTPIDLADTENEGKMVNIEKYDETSVENVLNNIENEFDNFKVQILQLVERRIVDYIVDMRRRGTVNEDRFKMFIDENDQFNINLSHSNVETFITSKVELPVFTEQSSVDPDTVITDLIKLSLPIYSIKDLNADKRLAVVEVTLLEIPTEETSNFQQFRIRIEIKPYTFFAKEGDTIVIDEMNGIYESDKLIHAKKDDSGYEEITIDAKKST